MKTKLNKAKWLLCNIGPPDRIQALSYAIQEIGRKVEVLSLKETYELFEQNDDSKDCNIFRGSINLSIALKSLNPIGSAIGILVIYIFVLIIMLIGANT